MVVKTILHASSLLACKYRQMHCATASCNINISIIDCAAIAIYDVMYNTIPQTRFYRLNVCVNCFLTTCQKENAISVFGR